MKLYGLLSPYSPGGFVWSEVNWPSFKCRQSCAICAQHWLGHILRIQNETDNLTSSSFGPRRMGSSITSDDEIFMHHKTILVKSHLEPLENIMEPFDLSVKALMYTHVKIDACVCQLNKSQHSCLASHQQWKKGDKMNLALSKSQYICWEWLPRLIFCVD